MSESLQSVMWSVLAESLIIPYIFHSPVVSTTYKVRKFINWCYAPLHERKLFDKRNQPYSSRSFHLTRQPLLQCLKALMYSLCLQKSKAL